MIAKFRMTLLAVLLIAMASAAFTSCDGCKSKTEPVAPDTLVTEPHADPAPAPLNELRGTVGENTTMHVLELIQEDGTAVELELVNAPAMGGMEVGDEMSVICNEIDGEMTAALAVNITALQHLWSMRADDGRLQSLEIDPKGRAITYNMSPANYDAWELRDGMLLLHDSQNATKENVALTDTFEILMLSDDSLVLGQHHRSLPFRRDN